MLPALRMGCSTLSGSGEQSVYDAENRTWPSVLYLGKTQYARAGRGTSLRALESLLSPQCAESTESFLFVGPSLYTEGPQPACLFTPFFPALLLQVPFRAQGHSLSSVALWWQLLDVGDHLLSLSTPKLLCL